MSNPEKVLDFLDLFGDWDASLAFVMMGAIAVAFIPFQKIDKKLITGAVLFGAGWGIAGICPAPSFTLIGLGHYQVLYFIVAMLVGVWIHHTNTFSYVVRDPATKACAIIDSVLDYDPASASTSTIHADKIIAYIKEQGLTVEWILETHVHADHLTAAQYLKAELSGKIAMSQKIGIVQETFGAIYHLDIKQWNAQQLFDYLFEDHESFQIGTLKAYNIPTPGHTPACLSYVIGDAVFVGDTLFMPDYGLAIGGLLGLTGAGGGILAVPALMASQGWTVAQAAPVGLLAVTLSALVGTFEGLFKKIVRYRAALWIALISIPSARYGVHLGGIISPVWLTLAFSLVMLVVAYRIFFKKVNDHTGVLCKVNQTTGRLIWNMKTALSLGAIGVVAGLLTGLLGVDEFQAAAIDRAVNYPRGVLEMRIHQHPVASHHCDTLQALEHLKDQPIYLICGTGGRSALATDTLQNMGFTQVKSVQGGFQAWLEQGYPVEK
ncbi:unnamed protein product [Notodromas monacha]|uniref:Rhodanese domain-containing protein n=1 Tax=Notodromas monacha TaxID=399045 RepID=A0A7R9BXY9_9CRUS|nr:unnamed protein product [Notodromas monacha]CAG0922710.1 unnamed protein product [Notodromas monacha]